MDTWDTVLVERLRYILNDIDPTNYTWTDLQLQKFLAIATIQVSNDLAQYSSTVVVQYTIQTQASGSAMIVPDPINNIAIGFDNLIVLKAACLIAGAELKKIGAQGGWKIIDDRSTIDGTKTVDAAKNTADTACGYYSDALISFKNGYGFNGSAILSPYASPRGQVNFKWPSSVNNYGRGL